MLLQKDKHESCIWNHSHKKRKDSLEGNLVRVLFASELEFSKKLVPRPPQYCSNVNIEWTVFFMWPDSWSTNISSFYYPDINLFLIDYDCCKLCNIWLFLFENNSRSYHYTGSSHWRKNLFAVITQHRVLYDNLKRQIKSQTFPTLILSVKSHPSLR